MCLCSQRIDAYQKEGSVTMEILTFRFDRVGNDKTLRIEAQMDEIGRVSTKDLNRAIEQIIDQHSKGNPGPVGPPADEAMNLPGIAHPLSLFSSIDCSKLVD